MGRGLYPAVAAGGSSGMAGLQYRNGTRSRYPLKQVCEGTPAVY